MVMPESEDNPLRTEEREWTAEDVPPSLKVVPTIHPPSPPLAADPATFFAMGVGAEELTFDVTPPEKPLHILEDLGTSPFPRGSFPLIGFLATTYENVSRYAVERAADAPYVMGGRSEKSGGPSHDESDRADAS